MSEPTVSVETPTVETTSNDLVSKPLVSSKPYDDDMLEAYEAESKENATEEASQEVKEEKKVEEPKQEEEHKEEVEAKATKNDKVDDGFEDVPVTRLINGKEVQFKVKDAIQAFVKQEEFNRNMDRRITHIAQREQRWQQEQNNFKDKVNKVIEISRKGDFVTGIRALAKLAAGSSGLDVVEFEKQYFDQLNKVRDVYEKMTPEQREAYFAKRAKDEAEAKAKALEEEKTINIEKSQLREKVSLLQRQYGLSETEFWENYKALEDNQVGEGKHFKTPHDIQPEDVIRFSLAVKHEEKVIEAAEKVGIVDEDILDKISDVTINDPSLTVEDIIEIINKSGIATQANPKAVENLNRKAEKSNIRFNQASSTRKENGKIPDGYDEEILEHLYRNQPRAYARIVR
ncbi:MAG: hypothetical protein BWY21_00361 [Parcubacteria group bacterium ADurb.Bin216]|nr:MAG: hypothetical protein BWY21_00361 [Parcubacteria group bacterium ADurb.Bin216]